MDACKLARGLARFSSDRSSSEGHSRAESSLGKNRKPHKTGSQQSSSPQAKKRSETDKLGGSENQTGVIGGGKGRQAEGKSTCARRENRHPAAAHTADDREYIRTKDQREDVRCKQSLCPRPKDYRDIVGSATDEVQSPVGGKCIYCSHDTSYGWGEMPPPKTHKIAAAISVLMLLKGNSH